MALELKLQLKLQQQLVMTPQLQQAIKLLQLNRLELVNLVSQELQENPVLEEVEGGEELTPAEVADQTPEDIPTRVDVDVADSATAAQSDAAETGETAPDGEPTPSDAEKIADIEWDNYMDAYPQTGLEGRGGEDDRPSIEATLTRRDTLGEHLEWQIRLSDFNEEEVAAALWILGNLDQKGYLCSTVEEIARQSGIDASLIEHTLAKVQKLDPTGVGARDLRECLLLQVDAMSVVDPLVREIIAEHLTLLEKRDFRSLTRATHQGIKEVAAAAAAIGDLEPRPGRAFGGDEPIYITPDIYVYKVADEFHILLNEDGLPKLRISNAYRSVMAQGRNAPKDTRDYVNEKIRAAQWLIKSIHQRQRTIYRVMQSIIKFQSEFFERGVQFLRPLNLRDIADDIEMHESTVSRVTTNKYVHTPQGIYELKYFFTSSIQRVARGEAVASESVKHPDSENYRQRGLETAPVRPENRRNAQVRRYRHCPPDRYEVSRVDENSILDEASAGGIACRPLPGGDLMKIMDILVKDAVIVDLVSETKDDVLAEMALALAKAEPALDAERLLEVLTEREALQSTGIGEGVAIPHGKIPGLERLVASFARSSKGIDFDSIDGQLTKLFFLLVVPEHSGGHHLKALARISRFFRDSEFRESLASAKQVEDVFKAIQDEDSKF